ncbi:hypothetical protein [Sinorhizobium meliloti]|uniref:hypothetical protein n=1 Tax=Rhizobium meliloti TaxID=382 RepID=UPI0012AA3DDA|nr:hypothetical protein [Sinorhizobium meliloti]QGJ74205.1 hypothetical protein C3L21_09405 [Sinorhizobium meliloti]
MTTLTKQLWDALCKIANPSTLIGLQDHERADKLQEIACTALSSAPAQVPEGNAQALDWSNFEGPKRNVEWKPDEQDLMYTAINYRDDEYGDQDEDAGQQIVERLLAAWRAAVISEQLTFEISARLLKERDEARAARAYPRELTADLCNVLSLMMWNTGPIAHVLRAGGAAIPTKGEIEQAHVLHWLTLLVLEHGPAWREKGEERLKEIRAAIAAEGSADA